MSSRNDFWNYSRHVGWTGQSEPLERLFTPPVIKQLSTRITELLHGVDPDGKRIVVTDENIIAVLSNVYSEYRPQTGDIHSRHIIHHEPHSWTRDIAERTINIIVRQVRSQIQTEIKNRNLSIWTTVLGESNAHGLRSHPKIKLRRKRPTTMQFNMRY